MVLNLKEVADYSSLEELSPTKRDDVARTTSKIYDPVGFITTVTVKNEIILSEVV